MPCRHFAGQTSFFRFSTLKLNDFHRFFLDDVADVLLDDTVSLVRVEEAYSAAAGAIYVPVLRVSLKIPAAFSFPFHEKR